MMKNIMLQDSEVSSSSLPHKTCHLVLKKTFNMLEDFHRCREEIANKNTTTIIAHICHGTKTIKTALGKKGGALDPSKNYSPSEISDTLSPYVQRGRYLIVSCTKEVLVESSTKDITLSYPLTLWVWRQEKENSESTYRGK